MNPWAIGIHNLKATLDPPAPEPKKPTRQQADARRVPELERYLRAKRKSIVMTLDCVRDLGMDAATVARVAELSDCITRKKVGHATILEITEK
jgi:hypothetical protein